MKLKHTPGPWKAKPTESFWNIYFPNEKISGVRINNRLPNQKANANLIQFTPELLDVLMELEYQVSADIENMGKHLNNAVADAQELIAKILKESKSV